MSLSGTVDVDINKCVRMALVHGIYRSSRPIQPNFSFVDIAESIVGDITPHCGVTAAEKFKLESDVFHYYVFKYIDFALGYVDYHILASFGSWR